MKYREVKYQRTRNGSLQLKKEIDLEGVSFAFSYLIFCYAVIQNIPGKFIRILPIIDQTAYSNP